MNKILLNTFILQLLFFAHTIGLYTQLPENEFLAAHARAGVLRNWYKSGFNSLGMLDCGKFENGSGWGLNGTLTLEYKLRNNVITGLGAGFFDRSGKLTTSRFFPSRDTTNGKIVQVTTENYISATLPYLEIFPEIRYNLTEKFISGPFRLAAAFRIGYNIGSYYRQKEKILEPSTAVFNIGGKSLKERNIEEGEIQNINKFSTGISFGIENLLKTGSRTFFTQQLVFDCNFSNVTKGIDWKVFGVRLDLGFRYSFFKDGELPALEIQTTPKQDTLPRDIVLKKLKVAEDKKPELILKIIGFDGVVNHWNELLASLPVVNAVFFERNSSQLPDFYLKKIDSLPSFFHGDPVEKHKFILGRIMDLIRKNPGSTITLEGTTCGFETENKGLRLSAERVEIVRKYLVESGISEKIIETTVRELPKIQSNQDYPEGMVENQRTDIFIHDAPLQEYLSLVKHFELDGVISVSVQYRNIPENEQVILRSIETDKEVQCLKPGIYHFPVKMEFDTNLTTLPFNFELSSHGLDRKENIILSTDTIPWKQLDLDVSRFDAVLRFDYNRSILNPDNRGLLKQLAAILPEDITIEIFGSADALGTEKRNIQLIFERAEVAKNYLSMISNKNFKIITRTDMQKYPETAPQGRFLNRSMRIKLKR